MTRRPDLPERLALALLAHGQLSGAWLSTLVAARKVRVPAELEANPMFERVGKGRGSLWRLDGNRMRPPWELQGTEDAAGSMSDVVERLVALEERVVRLELDREPATP